MNNRSSTVYEEGYVAGERGQMIQSCPYDRRTKLGRKWVQGFNDGERSMRVTKMDVLKLLEQGSKP